MPDVILYGASGHGKVIVDALAQTDATVVGFVDDDPNCWGKEWLGVKVLGGVDALSRFDPGQISCLVSVGDNAVRKRLVARLEHAGFGFCTACHPSSVVAAGVAIGEGTAIVAHAVVNPGAVIGKHVILNTACSVDHDCEVADFVHLSPGVHLAGGVRVGAGAHLGIGVSVIPGVSIGADTVVGAGAVVIGDLPEGATAVGVPARVINRSHTGKGNS